MVILEWIITIAIVLTALFFVVRSFYRASTGKEGCAGCTSTTCASRKKAQPDKDCPSQQKAPE